MLWKLFVKFYENCEENLLKITEKIEKSYIYKCLSKKL